MKKIIMITSLMFLFIIAGCSSGKTLKNISYNDLNNKLKNREDFVLYVGSSSCSHCAQFKPVLDKVVSKYELNVYYIDMGKVSESEYNAVKSKANLEGTPTVVYVKNGDFSIDNRIVGTKTEKETIQFFKDIKYIG